MTKHIILAEIAATILVALIFAVVCGRARGDAPHRPGPRRRSKQHPSPAPHSSPSACPHFPRTASPTPPTLPPLPLRSVARPPIAHPTPPPSFPRLSPSFLRRQEPTLRRGHLTTLTSRPALTHFPNSSLPPSRGEVRWGVGGHEPSPPSRARPNRSPHSPSVIPAPLSVIPAPLSVIPAQAGTTLRRGYLTTLTSRPALTPSPIHPSPLPGGRLGGGWEVTSRLRQSRAPQSPTPLPLRPVAHAPIAHPTPPPPSRARLNRPPHAPAVIPTPSPSFPRPSPSFLRPPPSFLRRQEPTHTPPTSGGAAVPYLKWTRVSRRPARHLRVRSRTSTAGGRRAGSA